MSLENCVWFSVIGKIYVAYLAYKIFAKVCNIAKLYFLSPALGLAADVKSFGKWAVVTGSTDGMGKCYAEHLAEKGMNLVLISRSVEKLNKVSNEIKKRFNSIEVRCIAVDFSHGTSIYETIQKGLVDLDVGVLVNNVGQCYESTKFFEECDDLELKQLITINCFSVVFMSKMVLPIMTEKKKGLIINLCSLSAHSVLPLLTVYAATKAFVRLFSKGIREEYKDKGIIVQVVSPSYVATKMTNMKSSLTIPDAETVVSSAMHTIGLSPEVAGCLVHELGLTLVGLLGENLTSKMFYKHAVKRRADFLANKQKEQ